MRKATTVFCALALWAGCIGTSSAQTNSIESFDVTPQGGKLIVRVGTSTPLPAVPPNFSVVSPARIAFDFPGVVNALGRNSQDIGQGDLQSMNVIQTGNRTRLVLNLRNQVAYEAALDGKNLVITLSPAAGTGSAAVTGPAAPSAATVPASFAEGRQDMRHSIREIDFRRGRAGEGRVIVDLSDSQTGIDIHVQGQNIVVDFLKTALPENLRRRMDVVDFATPVQTVSAYQQGENVRMIIEPTGQWEHNAYQSDDQFVVEVKPLSPEAVEAAKRNRYTGQKLSLNFQNVEVRSVLNVIADFTDLNIITSDSVTGNITLRLKDVPWDQALDIILTARGLDSRRNGNVIWIAPRDELATREKLALEAKQQINDLEQMRTEAFQINYQKAADVQKLLSDPQQRVLSKRGSAVVDTRTNQIFVQDTPHQLEQVRKLLAKIDIPVRQVMIEARIVEADDTFSKNLGARLGINDLSTGNKVLGDQIDNRLRYSLGGSLENTAAYAGAGAQGGTASLPGSLGVAMPANGLNGFPSGTLSMILFNSQMNYFLNMELSALEADGKGKIVSSPRVLTANNVEALIEQGTEIPYQQASSSGATAVSFQKANLSLKVKPQITPDGQISMTVEVNKDAPGATSTAGVQINTKHVKTEVLVENGGTVVIGGIYEETERRDITKVPFFGDLPLIGVLFRNDARSKQKTELLVFITPRIVNERLTVR